MWWILALVGILIGLTNDASASSVITLCIVGALIGAYIKKVSNASKSHSPQNNITDDKQTPEVESIQNLRNTIIALEKRLSIVEKQLSNFALSEDEFIEVKNEVFNAELQNSNIQKTDESHNHSEIVTPENGNGETQLSSTQTEFTNTANQEITLPVIPATSSSEALMTSASTNSYSQVNIPEEITTPPIPKKPWKERLPKPIANFIFGGNALVKIGGLILFLGLAFLLRYTAEKITVPVELRYVSVALTGIGILVLGWVLRHKRRDYALILQGIAIGLFYLTTFSAMKFHHLISPEVGFGFMLLVSILSAALAILQKAPMLAIIAAIEGFITPILASTGENRPLGLFTYISILNIGIFFISWFNAWRVLNLIAFVGTFTLSIGWAHKYYADSQYYVVQPFLIFFFILFALIGVLFARRTLIEAKLEYSERNPISAIKHVGRVDSALVFGNPITAFGLQYLLVNQFEFAAAFSALMIAFFYLILAKFIFSKEKQGLALLAESYVIVAAIFGTLAIPLGLEGTWTSAAWAIEGAGMYWLGIRQSRPYARGFAYLVIAGSIYKLLHSISINDTPFEPLLSGSLLGPTLFAAAVLVMWHLHRQSKAEEKSEWESVPHLFLPWIGIGALSFLPWMLLSPAFAAASVAFFAVIIGQIGLKFSIIEFRPIAAAMQGISLLAFLQTLHLNNSPEKDTFLADGIRGMLSALIIALSILFNSAHQMLKAKRQAIQNNLPPNWTWINGVGVLAACSLIHLAMLYVIDFEQAAWIWPLTSCLLFWASMRMSHVPLAVLTFILQCISAIYGLIIGISEHNNYSDESFLIPLSLAISAWWCADQIQTEAKKCNANIESTTAKFAWNNPWCRHDLAIWLPILWGAYCWIQAWYPTTENVLIQENVSSYITAAFVLIAISTTGLFYYLAKIRNWPQIGAASCIGLGLFIYSAINGSNQAQTNYLPSSNLGWLVWPLALFWHLHLLRAQQKWLEKVKQFQSSLHILGFWFFLILVATEVKNRLGIAVDPWSSWSLLGWVIVPAVTLWLIGSRSLEKIWPLNQFKATYVEIACMPVALYLLIWCWISNLVSSGNADPLPYIPLLNPLELAQWITLISIFYWWKNLPESSIRLNEQVLKIIMSLTAFAILTGSVLRAVHHLGGVPWEIDALFDSRLAQASLSIIWAISSVSLMILGNRKLSRQIWMAGAVLLGIVVVKLFIIELAERGGIYRVVSFIGVGIAILAVGYFAPVPTKKEILLDDANNTENVPLEN